MPGIIVRVRDPEEAAAAERVITAARKREDWSTVAQQAAIYAKWARRQAKDLPDLPA